MLASKAKRSGPEYCLQWHLKELCYPSGQARRLDSTTALITVGQARCARCFASLRRCAWQPAPRQPSQLILA